MSLDGIVWYPNQQNGALGLDIRKLVKASQNFYTEFNHQNDPIRITIEARLVTEILVNYGQNFLISNNKILGFAS